MKIISLILRQKIVETKLFCAKHSLNKVISKPSIQIQAKVKKMSSPSNGNVNGSETYGLKKVEDVPSSQADLFLEDQEWEKEAVAFAEKIEKEHFGEDKNSSDKISKD